MQEEARVWYRDIIVQTEPVTTNIYKRYHCKGNQNSGTFWHLHQYISQSYNYRFTEWLKDMILLYLGNVWYTPYSIAAPKWSFISVFHRPISIVKTRLFYLLATWILQASGSWTFVAGVMLPIQNNQCISDVSDLLPYNKTRSALCSGCKGIWRYWNSRIRKRHWELR